MNRQRAKFISEVRREQLQAIRNCDIFRFEKWLIEWPSKYLRLDKGVCTLTEPFKLAWRSLFHAQAQEET